MLDTVVCLILAMVVANLQCCWRGNPNWKHFTHKSFYWWSFYSQVVKQFARNYCVKTIDGFLRCLSALILWAMVNSCHCSQLILRNFNSTSLMAVSGHGNLNICFRMAEMKACPNSIEN